MSAASRLARADKQIVKAPEPAPAPQPPSDLWANPEAVPGGFATVPLDRPLHAGGLEWLPSHAAPWNASIGYALAVELGSQIDAAPVSLTKAGA